MKALEFRERGAGITVVNTIVELDYLLPQRVLKPIASICRLMGLSVWEDLLPGFCLKEPEAAIMVKLNSSRPGYCLDGRPLDSQLLDA